MNLFNLFVNPRQAVKDSLSNPNTALIGVLLIAHVLVGLIIFVLRGLTLNLVQSVLQVVNSIILVLVLTVIVYFFSKFSKQQKSLIDRNKLFLGLIQAFALTFFYILLGTIFYGVPILLLNKELAKPIQDATAGTITSQELFTVLDSKLSTESTFPLSIILGASLVLISLMFLYILYLWYLVVSETLQAGFVKNIIFFVILLLLGYLVMALKGFLF